MTEKISARICAACFQAYEAVHKACPVCGAVPEKRQSPMDPAARRAQILTAAVNVARTGGYLALTRSNVARHAGAAAGLINRYFGTVGGLRDAVMREAIEQRLLPLLAQGITHGNPIALQAPEGLRGAAVVSVGGDL